MCAYVTRDLPGALAAKFPAAELSRQGIFGHSMGGHGALTLHLKMPEAYRSVSAFAPVQARPSRATLLIDQGDADQFLDEQLKPETLAEACGAAGQPFELRLRSGYDHSYYFIQTFIEDHLRHHAAALRRQYQRRLVVDRRLERTVFSLY